MKGSDVMASSEKAKISSAESKWQAILERELQSEMDAAPAKVESHNESHIRRVWKNAKKIGVGHGVDWETLIAAVYFHDIGRHYPEGTGIHGPISYNFAKKALDRISFPEEKISPALEAIKYHDDDFPNEKRQSPEAKILYDADKIDSLGIIGISRFLSFFSRRGKDAREICEI